MILTMIDRAQRAAAAVAAAALTSLALAAAPSALAQTDGAITNEMLPVQQQSQPPLGGPRVQSGAIDGCEAPLTVARYAQDWINRRPAKALGADGTLEDAYCTQKLLVEQLRLTLGEPIGYTVGLTNPELQKAFNTDSPIRGVALEGMILDNGAIVDQRFGYWPFVEADILVEVADAKINEAKTPLEALQHISVVRPFIGLVDLGVDAKEPLTPITLTAQNAAGRFGVLGEPIAVEPTQAFVDALGTMRATLTNADGQVLTQGAGDVILGHPLNSVLWLVQDGVELRRGDWVNLGSFGVLAPAKDAKGLAIAVYEGLPGAQKTQTIQVLFR